MTEGEGKRSAVDEGVSHGGQARPHRVDPERFVALHLIPARQCTQWPARGALSESQATGVIVRNATCFSLIVRRDKASRTGCTMAIHAAPHTAKGGARSLLSRTLTLQDAHRRIMVANHPDSGESNGLFAAGQQAERGEGFFGCLDGRAQARLDDALVKARGVWRAAASCIERKSALRTPS